MKENRKSWNSVIKTTVVFGCLTLLLVSIWYRNPAMSKTSKFYVAYAQSKILKKKNPHSGWVATGKCSDCHR